MYWGEVFRRGLNPNISRRRNKKEAAKLLELDKSTLYDKLYKFGLLIKRS